MSSTRFSVPSSFHKHELSTLSSKALLKCPKALLQLLHKLVKIVPSDICKAFQIYLEGIEALDRFLPVKKSF